MGKKQKKTYRKTILTIHKILGLATGLVVFIVSITGCIWAFKEEIESLYDDYKYVTPVEAQMLKASEVKRIAEEAIPDRIIHGVIYGQPDEAIEVVFYESEPAVFYHTLFRHRP